jgi:DNA polymerase-3 subunit gamma/tau
MTHQATARKWRPKNFQSMIGQQHVLQALINALTHQRLHHAYLFTGTRGVGKTTLARILAKCLQCEKGISAQPCGTCDACLSIDTGAYVDVLEIDAASRTKVEDTRELLDNVQYLPTQGRYKIYIIDEVHMLSSSSFNALLKTLEEPPSHVCFILATTDPQKCPATVLSRCLQFHLKHLEPAQISKQLAHILQTENIPFEASALDLLAEAGQGSMRDALSLLDQAIAYGGNLVQTESVRMMLGTLNPQTITDLLTALHAQDGAALMKVVEAVASDSGNFEQAIQALIQALHHIALIQAVPALADSQHAGYNLIKPFSGLFSPETVQLFYQIALHGRRDMQWAPSPRAGFEMTCMRLLAFYPEDKPVVAMSKPKSEMPVRLAQPAPAPAPAPIAIIDTPLIQPEPEPPSDDTLNWLVILPQLKLSGMASALASHCVVHAYNGHQVILNLAPKHAPLYTKAVSDRIAQALSDFLKHTISLEIKLVETTQDTPAQRKQEATEQAFAQAKSELESDPLVQELVSTFDAELTHIRPLSD